MTPRPMDFRGPIGFRKAVGFSRPSTGPMSSREAHRNATEKSACQALRSFLFFFGVHLISTGKTIRILVKTFFFGDHNSGKTAAFSPSVLEFTKPEIRHI